MRELRPGWTREGIIWAAGLFEGEGSIHFSQETGKTGRVVLQLGMTDEDVVEKFHHILQIGSIGGPYSNGDKDYYKPLWLWRCSRFEDTQAVLAAFYPFLGVRRKEKIRESLQTLADLSPRRQYGTEEKCGRGHLRVRHSYRKHPSGDWCCRECRRLTERKRNSESRTTSG